MADVQISLQLEIRPGNKVLVPGCEPTSAMSSRTLGIFLQKTGRCKNALVPLQTALNAIPGSYVKNALNFNRGGSVQRWLVLPPTGPECPCQSADDFYELLRSLAVDEAPVTEAFDKCNIVGMGYCPSPDFNVETRRDPYVKEGTFPGDVGILPPVPPWGVNP